MRIHILVASIAALAIAAPAAATVASPKAQVAKPARAARAPLYCMKDEKLVGSRIQKQTCMTKSDWAKEGVDIDQLQRG
jgi:hypothetical protein